MAEGIKEQCPSFFQLHPYSHHLPADLDRMENRECKPLLSTLEEICKTERDIYDCDVAYPNLHAYLLLRRNNEDEDDLEKCNELLVPVLQSEPHNLIALQIKKRLLHENDQLADEKDVEEKIKGLMKNSTEFKLLRLCACAEIAFYLARLDSSLYPAAAELLENCLSETDGITASRITFWQYELAQVYNRMLNKDFSINLDHFDPVEMYSRIQELLNIVIHTKLPCVLSIRSMVDLADAFKKCESAYRDCNVHLDWGKDKLFERAYGLNSHDPHVLERYGRHLRHRGTCPQGQNRESHLKHAEKLFHEALKLCPKRHVVWHQLGLTYRALWMLKNKLHYSNIAGHQTSKTKNKKRKGKKGYLDSLAEAVGKSARSDSEHDLTTKASINSLQQIKYMRAYNPPCENTSHVEEYLKKAKECFENANKCLDGKASPYLIDLARTCISLMEYKNADKWFKKACKNEYKTRTNCCDEATKFEQYGLFRWEQLQKQVGECAISDERYIQEKNNIKELLRQSVERTEHARIKPRDAYTLLKIIIEDERASAPLESDALDMELYFIEMSTGNFQRAHNNLMKAQHAGANVSWEKIDLLARQGLVEQAYHSLYMLLHTRQLNILPEPNKVKMVLNIACKAAALRYPEQTGNADCEDGTRQPSIYRDIFELLCQSNTSESTGVSQTSHPHPVLHTHFTILAQDSGDWIVQVLCTILQDICRFNVFVVSDEGNDDIGLGQSILCAAEDAIKSADVVLVHCDKDEGLIPHHVDGLICSDRSNKVCMVNHECDKPSKWTGVPSVQLQCQMIDQDSSSIETEQDSSAARVAVSRSDSVVLGLAGHRNVHQFMHDLLFQVFAR